MRNTLPVLMVTLALTFLALQPMVKGASKPLIVAVIDTGFNIYDREITARLCKDFPAYDYTGEGIQDAMGHGTKVMHIIMDQAGKSNYCFVVLKYYTKQEGHEAHSSGFVKALRQLRYIKADLVNISGGGPLNSPDEPSLIYSMPGTQFIVAAGNEGLDISVSGNEFYPASYELDNVTAVGALDTHLKHLPSSNYGRLVRTWEVGEFPFGAGTSFATAVKTGKVISTNNR